MTDKTGGTAFPCESYDLTRGAWVKEEGMTLRDYFAAKYMQGIASNPACTDTFNDGGLQETSKWAYKMADAMIKAREQ